MKEYISKIRNIQLVASFLLQLEPDLQIFQAHSDVVDLFAELPVDKARFAIVTWPSKVITSENIKDYVHHIVERISEIDGCPLIIAHYDVECGLMADFLVKWNFGEFELLTNPQLKILSQDNIRDFFFEIRRQDCQIRMLEDKHLRVVKKIILNEDRNGNQCNSEWIYLREFTPEYKMNPKPVASEQERFKRYLNGQPQDEYPHDLLDDKIAEAVQSVYPNVQVHNSLLATATDYRQLLKYRNYQKDYAEFRILPDINSIPIEQYPRMGKIDGMRFVVDIFMMMRPRNAFANEGFNLTFPLMGWFDTLNKLVSELHTLHRLSEIIK